MEEEKTVMEETAVGEDIDLDEFLDFDDEDDKPAEEGGKSETEKEKKPTQSREERAHFAQLKREQKEKDAQAEDARKAELAKIREQTALETKLDVIKTNTFTNKPIKDEYDLKTYEMMLSIKENGGDPINDLADYISSKAREVGTTDKENQAKKIENEKLEEKRKTEIRDSVNKGFAEIRDKYNVNLKELTKNPDFLKELKNLDVLNGGASVETAYLVMLSKKSFTTKKETNESEDIAKKLTSSPSSTSNPTAPKDTSKMSSDEFEAYWNKKYGG